MSKPSRDDVIRVAGNPVAWLSEAMGSEISIPESNLRQKQPPYVQELWKSAAPLYTEAQLLAMYAAGAEDMRERAANECENTDQEYEQYSGVPLNLKYTCADAIRALPINTEGEQG